MTPRLPCLVPFCRATRGLRKTDDGLMPDEWICSRHWRLVSPSTRRAHSKLFRLGAKAARLNRDLPRLFSRARLAWGACKREAIERAVGISA